MNENTQDKSQRRSLRGLIFSENSSYLQGMRYVPFVYFQFLPVCCASVDSYCDIDSTLWAGSTIHDTFRAIMILSNILNAAPTRSPSLRIGKRLIGCFVNHNVGNHQWPAYLKITRAFQIYNAVCPLNCTTLNRSVRSDLFGNGIQISLQVF